MVQEASHDPDVESHVSTSSVPSHFLHSLYEATVYRDELPGHVYRRVPIHSFHRWMAVDSVENPGIAAVNPEMPAAMVAAFHDCLLHRSSQNSFFHPERSQTVSAWRF